MKIIKNKYIMALAAAMALSASGCSDYLDVTPENSQVADDYWKTESDVDNVLFGGYYVLRSSINDYLIPWGESRAGIVYNKTNNVLQRWQVSSTSKFAVWSYFYQIINVANTVIERAHEAQENDDTYNESTYNRHLTEAYFLRSLSLFYLVRNFRDVPMPLKAYTDDKVEVNLPKVSEDSVILQIKQDLNFALQTGAAKEKFSTTWETKGRATRWALLALMADVCLWHEDYAECIEYCDALLNANAAGAPAFMPLATRSNYMSMFNPGNSNESIFELQFNYEEDQTNNLPTLFYNDMEIGTYRVSSEACTEWQSERLACGGSEDEDDSSTKEEGAQEAARYKASFVGAAAFGYVWKYVGSTTEGNRRMSAYYDPNFIIYRMADILLMKAEAEVRLLEDMPASIAEKKAQVAAWIAAHTEEAYDEDTDEWYEVAPVLTAEIQALKDEVDAWESKNNERRLIAATLINRIRLRAGYADAENILAYGLYDDASKKQEAYEILSAYDQESLLSMILDERKKEFLGEGKIWYDMLRMGRANNNQYKQSLLVDQVIKYASAAGNASFSWLRSVLNSDNALFLPINASDLERNPNLVQNPYYN